jgi:hypothetical protein
MDVVDRDSRGSSRLMDPTGVWKAVVRKHRYMLAPIGRPRKHFSLMVRGAQQDGGAPCSMTRPPSTMKMRSARATAHERNEQYAGDLYEDWTPAFIDRRQFEVKTEQGGRLSGPPCSWNRVLSLLNLHLDQVLEVIREPDVPSIIRAVVHHGELVGRVRYPGYP